MSMEQGRQLLYTYVLVYTHLRTVFYVILIALFYNFQFYDSVIAQQNGTDSMNPAAGYAVVK